MLSTCPHCGQITTFSAETETPERCPHCGRSLGEADPRPSLDVDAAAALSMLVGIFGVVVGSGLTLGGCACISEAPETGGVILGLGAICLLLATIVLRLPAPRPGKPPDDADA